MAAEIQTQTQNISQIQLRKEMREKVKEYLQVLGFEYKEGFNGVLMIKCSLKQITVSDGVTIVCGNNRNEIEIYQKENIVIIKLGNKNMIIPFRILVQYFSKEKELRIHI